MTQAPAVHQTTLEAIRREAWDYSTRKPGKVPPADSPSRPHLARLWRLAYLATIKRRNVKTLRYAGLPLLAPRLRLLGPPVGGGVRELFPRCNDPDFLAPSTRPRQGRTSTDFPGASCSQFFKDWEQTGNTQTQYPCGCPSVPSCPSQKDGIRKREHDQCAAGPAWRMRFRWRWPPPAAVASSGVPPCVGPSGVKVDTGAKRLEDALVTNI